MESGPIRKIYDILLGEYGGQGWWPVTRREGGEPEYLGGPRDSGERFEVAVGAVLTQNTAWRNAARAVSALSAAGLIEPSRLAAAPREKIAELIRPSGYYNQKSRRLGILARYFAGLEDAVPTREGLLALEGVGPETADSIMLYAFEQPFFVVDAYTKRLLSRLGVIRGDESYDRIRGLFEDALGENPKIFNEYHALVVEHCKRRCMRTPECGGCPLVQRCDFPRS
jgi:endonuclease-3 related protein